MAWLAMQRLKIDDLSDFGMREDVVAPVDPAQLEAQCFGEVAQIGKGHIGHRPARKTHQELPLVHGKHGNPRLGRDSDPDYCFRSDTLRPHRVCELQTVNQLDGYRVEILEQR
jgi:hypothetical protein